MHCSLATGGPGAATRHAPFGRPRRPLGTFPRGESTSSARRRAKPPTRNRFLAKGRKRAYLSFYRITKDFASAEATRGLSDRPLDPFGAHPCMGGRNIPQETKVLRKAGNGPTFLFPHHKGFRLCGGDQGAFRSPPGPLRGPLFLVDGRNLSQETVSLQQAGNGPSPIPSHKCKQPRWTFPPPWPYCIYYIFSRTTFTSSCPARTGISWAVSNPYPAGTCSTCIT